MQSLNILIVEDNNVLAEQMGFYLREKGYYVSDIVHAGEKAIMSITRNPPDLVIMDIKLEGKLDGIDTALQITKDYELPVIYITEHDDEDIFKRAKLTFPSNYLTKPFTMLQLERAVDIAFVEEESEVKSGNAFLSSICNKFVFICKNAGSYHKVMIEDILIIQALGSSSIVYIDALKDPIKVSMSSNILYQKLNSPIIKRVHRSYFVNLTKIEILEKSSIIIGNIKIPISKEYNDSLHKIFRILKRTK